MDYENPSYDDKQNGRLVRFRRPFSEFMPPLAVAIVDRLTAMGRSSEFLADLTKGLGEWPDGPFEPLSTNYTKHMRVSRLLHDVVEVDGHLLLTIEGNAAQRKRYEKVKRVVMREGKLPPVPMSPRQAQRLHAEAGAAQLAQELGVGDIVPPDVQRRTFALTPPPGAAVPGALEIQVAALAARLAAVERMLMDGAGPLPADATAEIARIETDFKRRTFDLGEQQIRLLQRLNRIDPPAPVAD